MDDVRLENIPFLAPDNRQFNYDYARLCAATPIPFAEYPVPLFYKGYLPDYDPPLLYCGWRLSDEAFFELVSEHFHDNVCYKKNGNPQKRMTIINLPYLLREQYGIPEQLEERCEMPRLGDSTGNLSYTLVVGSNYKGILPKEEFIDPIRNDLFGGKDPQWYLSPKRFKWKRRTDIVTQEIIDEVEERMREEREELSRKTEILNAPTRPK